MLSSPRLGTSSLVRNGYRRPSALVIPEKRHAKEEGESESQWEKPCEAKSPKSPKSPKSAGIFLRNARRPSALIILPKGQAKEEGEETVPRSAKTPGNAPEQFIIQRRRPTTTLATPRMMQGKSNATPRRLTPLFPVTPQDIAANHDQSSSQIQTSARGRRSLTAHPISPASVHERGRMASGRCPTAPDLPDVMQLDQIRYSCETRIESAPELPDFRHLLASERFDTVKGLSKVRRCSRSDSVQSIDSIAELSTRASSSSWFPKMLEAVAVREPSPSSPLTPFEWGESRFKSREDLDKEFKEMFAPQHPDWDPEVGLEPKKVFINGAVERQKLLKKRRSQTKYLDALMDPQSEAESSDEDVSGAEVAETAAPKVSLSTVLNTLGSVRARVRSIRASQVEGIVREVSEVL